MTMAGSNYTGGLGAIIWAIIGLVIGMLFGWYYGDYASYPLVGVVFGWLAGLLICESDEDAHH